MCGAVYKKDGYARTDVCIARSRYATDYIE